MKFVFSEEVRNTLESLWVKNGMYYSDHIHDSPNVVWGKVIVVTEYNTVDNTVIRQWVSGVLSDEYFTINTLEQVASHSPFVIGNKNSGPTLMVAEHGGLEQAIAAWHEGRLPDAPVYWNLELVDIDQCVWRDPR